MIKTIIFDFGDVLVRDTAKYLERKYKYNNLPHPLKARYDKAYDLSESGKISHNRLCGIICQTLTPKLTPEQVKKEMYRANKLLPPARLLKKLKKNYQIIILYH